MTSSFFFFLFFFVVMKLLSSFPLSTFAVGRVVNPPARHTPHTYTEITEMFPWRTFSTDREEHCNLRDAPFEKAHCGR